VRLLQTNVAQDQKFAVERMPQAIAQAIGELTGGKTDLVVGPETVIPLLPQQLDDLAPGAWGALRQHFAAGQQAALIGVPLGSFERGYTNSVVGLSAATAGQNLYQYDKAHLVPFGEFIPTGFRWFTNLMNIPLGDFNRGHIPAPSFHFKGQRLAPNICYEDLFGEELAARFVDPAQAPTVMVNVSNLGWFGDSAALGQHLNISRLRSLELQRPMLRSTNTGATAIIDHQGRVLAQLAPLTRAVLEGQVQGREGVTPFAWWAARGGLWPLWGLGLATVVGMAGMASRRRLAA
jgi:apolipoprotein N-acyltransferase